METCSKVLNPRDINLTICSSIIEHVVNVNIYQSVLEVVGRIQDLDV
jgi:hypothetical protein